MSRRIILAVIIIIIAVILVLGGYYFYIAYLPKPAFNNSNISNTNEQSVTGNNINLPSDQNTNAASNQSQPQDDQAKIKLLATVFSQNYGSYSNQTNLTNFDEIYSFMGATMQKWVRTTYKAEIMKQHPAGVYYAIETKVLNIQINKLDAAKGTAEILANTQRQEFSGTPSNPKVFSQNLLLNLVKVNDNWIVDSAYWQ